MAWLLLIILCLLVLGATQHLVSEKNKRVILNVLLSVFVLIISGLITRIAFMRLSTWFAGWSAAGGPYSIIVAIIGIAMIPIVFILLVLAFFLIIKKVRKK